MTRLFGQLLDSPRTPLLASLFSLALGLTFTFVWAPHPWPWEGIDQYHDLARSIVRGDGFPTTDVPWGYAYYVAACYLVFGIAPVAPVLGQVILNATMPLLLFSLVKPLAGRRTAALSALIVGVFSFNTVYTSTLASDAICSVLFIAAVLCFTRGHASGRTAYYAASGVLAGLAPQFRPNLLLLPALVAVLSFAWLAWHGPAGRLRQRAWQLALFLGLSVLAVVPWVVRNYQLAGVFLPTSSHGGVQLWYGSLQVGPYLEDRSANPRAAFETPAFDYSSLAETPILVSATLADCATGGAPPALVYWTDHEARPITVAPDRVNGRSLTFAIPGQPDPTAVHWRIDTAAGSSNPSIYFISSDHLGDLDRHADWFDIFDVVRLARHAAWPEVAAATPAGGIDASGVSDRAGLQALVSRLLGDPAPVSNLAVEPDAVELQLADGSSVRVPRTFSGSIADLEVTGALATRLLSARLPATTPPAPAAGACRPVAEARVNDVFYRKELQQLARYTTLALDNIRRQPLAFAAAAAYRAVRLFIVRPTGDKSTTYQFTGGVIAYTSGLVLSLSYFLLFLAGVAVAWRRRSALLPLLVPIVYVPATICFVLTNQRYTVTVQPLMFAFVALALVTCFGWDSDEGPKPPSD